MSKSKRVILSAGGTGGHLFPAQVVAQKLQDSCELLFVAGGLTQNPYFEKNTYPFEEISTATFSLSNPLKVAQGGIKVGQGVWQSHHILRTFQPDLVVGFGSFFTLPLLTAAWMRRLPVVLHEQNALPGKVNRLFSRYAMTTGITFPASAQHLKGKYEEVSFPLRQHSAQSGWDYFGLRPGVKTVLVFGGSQGARLLNQVVAEAMSRLMPCQVLHFVGKHGNCEEVAARYRTLGIAHVVRTFEPRVDLALQIADLAICRAGASTVAELIAHATPAILVPFPYASENHQVDNARYFVEQVKGGAYILEQEFDANRLDETLYHLDLPACRQAIAAHRDSRCVRDFTTLILELL